MEYSKYRKMGGKNIYLKHKCYLFCILPSSFKVFKNSNFVFTMEHFKHMQK